MNRLEQKIALLLSGLALALLPACGGGASSGKLQIVAAENFWGSIASQLAGNFGTVTSIVSNPNSDPHEYQSTTADARTFAEADYVIINGAGYDAWASHILSANPSPQRKVLVVSDLLGRHSGDNPHFWYSPDYVKTVARQITQDLIQLDPADQSALSTLQQSFLHDMQPYLGTVESIAQKYDGAPVAATEDIFYYMAQALHLDVISPPEFMSAVAQGNDPSAASVARFQDQLTSRQAALLIYNSQTVTPLTDSLKSLAAQQSIPAIGISEIEPPGTTFETWQTQQLRSIEKALGG